MNKFYCCTISFIFNINSFSLKENTAIENKRMDKQKTLRKLFLFSAFTFYFKLSAFSLVGGGDTDTPPTLLPSSLTRSCMDPLHFTAWPTHPYPALPPTGSNSTKKILLVKLKLFTCKLSKLYPNNLWSIVQDIN